MHWGGKPEVPRIAERTVETQRTGARDRRRSLVSVRNRKRIAVGVFALTADEAAPRHDLSELGPTRNQRLSGRSNIFGPEADLWRTLADLGSAIVKGDNASVGIEFFPTALILAHRQAKHVTVNGIILAMSFVKSTIRLIDSFIGTPPLPPPTRTHK